MVEQRCRGQHNTRAADQVKREKEEKKENSNDHKAQMKIENEFGVRVI